MKKRLNEIAGQSVITGMTSSDKVIKLIRLIHYYDTQLRMLKKDVKNLDETDVDVWIDDVLKNGEKFLE